MHEVGPVVRRARMSIPTVALQPLSSIAARAICVNDTPAGRCASPCGSLSLQSASAILARPWCGDMSAR